MKSIGVTLQRTYLRKNCKKKYFVTSSYLTSLVDITLFSITPNSFYNVIHWTCQSNFDSSDEKTTARKNYCTIFSFFKRPEKMAFPKKSCWNLIFLVLSGKIIFLFPENMILPKTENKRWSFSKKKKKIHGNIFTSNVLKRWSFQKGSRRGMIFLALSRKVVFFSWKHGIFSLDGKRERDDLSQEIDGNMIFSIWYVPSPHAENKSKTTLPHKNTPKKDWHSRSTH